MANDHRTPGQVACEAALDEGSYEKISSAGRATWDRVAAAVLAHAAPPAVPESVRRTIESADAVSSRERDRLFSDNEIRLYEIIPAKNRAADTCLNWVRTLLSTPSARADTHTVSGGVVEASVTFTEAENEETYKIGHRDGYEEGVQDAAMRVGLDGEYRWSTEPERNTPDAPTMLERIAEHVEALAAAPAAPEPAAGGVVDVGVSGPVNGMGEPDTSGPYLKLTLSKGEHRRDVRSVELLGILLLSV